MLSCRALVALFLLSGCSGSQAEVTQSDPQDPITKHLRKIDKVDPHRFRLGRIDFIYVINLDERPEKMAHTRRELQPYGIDAFRFSAVNGWKLSQETIDDVGVTLTQDMTKGMMGNYFLPEDNGKHREERIGTVGRVYYAHGMSRGAIGINLSHLSILQDAYDSGYQRIWVMEDDIEVKRHPALLSDMTEHLDALVGNEGWDILFTDQDTKGQDGKYVACASYALKPSFTPADPMRAAFRQVVSEEFTQVGSRYGAYSMIVNRVGMKKILDYFKKTKIFLPYDMEFTMPPGINLFAVRQDVVSTQAQALSDNGAPFYELKKERAKEL